MRFPFGDQAYTGGEGNVRAAFINEHQEAFIEHLCSLPPGDAVGFILLTRTDRLFLPPSSSSV
jgi:hypothetical protein